MKDLIAKEFLYFFVGLVVAIPVGFLFLYIVDIQPAGEALNQDEKVLEMDLLFIGGLLGFVGVYLIRLTVWAVKKLLVSE